MIFVKHIFDFFQTAAQILMNFDSYMHLSKVNQVFQIKVVWPIFIELC